MTITLDVDDDEVSFFIKLAKSLPFVNEITTAAAEESEFPDWHLPVIKERIMNIDATEFTDAIEFIKTLKN